VPRKFKINERKKIMQAQSAGKTVEQTVAAIQALDLDPIKFKLMDPEEGQGWSRECVDQMAIEYKRFLTLSIKYPEETIAPSKDVDKFWHGHILDTMKYAEDCQNVFGYFLHHFPYFGMRGEEDAANLAEAGKTTNRLYENEFGEAVLRRAAYCSVAKPAYCSVAVTAEKAAYCSVAKPAYCSVAVTGEKAAYCSVAKPAYCSVAVTAEKAAYCSVAKPAYCSVAVTGEKAAYCSVAKPAYCSVAVTSEKAAYCSVAKPAYCSVAVTGKNAAYCSVAIARSAYCSVAATGKKAAYCSVAANDESARGGQKDKLNTSLRPRLALAA
jgi:hypothetical protein